MIASLLIGLAVWCAAGTISVASPDSATARLAVAAPWWIFFIGIAIGAAVKPWRTRPLTALPALLSILPWLPIPLPAVALIWTGPMAWVPILAALAMAVGLDPLRPLARILSLFDPDDATVAAFVFAITIGGLSAWAANPNTPSGDEPHYLMITQSLLKDGDLDLDNNHANKDYLTFMRGGGDLHVDMRQRGIHGEGYSIHAPGVAVLVAPVFQTFELLGLHGYTGARLLMVLLTALGAMLTWRLCWRVTNSPAAAWCGWTAVMLTPTFALQSFMVFPDAPGLFVIAGAALVLVQLARGDMPGVVTITLTGIALASLPWLHTRFAILAAGFGLAIAMRLLVPGHTPPRQRNSLAPELDPDPIVTSRDRWIRIGLLLVTPAVSAVLWFWFFKVHYGTFDPRAPYGHEEQNFAWVIPATLGLFFDGQYGIAAYAPAVALAFVGWWRRTEIFSRRLAIELALIVFAYLTAVTTVRMWWAGNPATPARFLTAVLPLLAVPIAVAWTRISAATRTLAAALITIGAGVTTMLLCVDRAGLSWNSRVEQPLWLQWVSPVANLSRVWPVFFWNESRFPLHVAVWLVLATGLWFLACRVIRPSRVAVAVWGIAMLTIASPIGWALGHAAALDPAQSQLRVVAGDGAGARVFAIGAGKFSHLRSLKDTMTIRPLEPGPYDEDRPPQLLVLLQVPAGRYTVHAKSTAASNVTLRLYVGGTGSAWREFNVAGTGEFAFPFVLPGPVSSIVLDADPALRKSLQVYLTVDGSVPPGDINAMMSAARYGSVDVAFFDDQVFIDKDPKGNLAPGFWVRGRSAARFSLRPEETGPVTPMSVRVRVRNGGASNSVTIETGSFKRVLTMAPFQEQEMDVPLTPTGTAIVRVASSDGFVPGKGDPRLLGVWIEPR